ncbi:HAD hydrolase family protein [Patescibacteria group bacterium]|nr:HAD hydrolase family protein [Patescibacteria group bacterium]
MTTARADQRRHYFSFDIDSTLIPSRTDDDRAYTEDDVVQFAERNPALVDQFIALLRQARTAGGHAVLNSGRDHEFCKIVAEVICGDQVDAIVSESGCGLLVRSGAQFSDLALSPDVRPHTVEALNGVRTYMNHEVATRYGAQARRKQFTLSFARPSHIVADTFDKNVRRLLYDRLPQIVGLVDQFNTRYSVDFVPKGADKGKALLRYIERCGDRREEVSVIAAGDAQSDLPTFAVADIVIMAQQAPHELRKAVFQRRNFLCCTAQTPYLGGITRELARFVR